MPVITHIFFISVFEYSCNFTVFHFSGNRVLFAMRLNSKCSDFGSDLERLFRSKFPILSGPMALFTSSSCRAFSISSVVK